MSFSHLPGAMIMLQRMVVSLEEVDFACCVKVNLRATPVLGVTCSIVAWSATRALITLHALKSFTRNLFYRS